MKPSCTNGALYGVDKPSMPPGASWTEDGHVVNAWGLESRLSGGWPPTEGQMRKEAERRWESFTSVTGITKGHWMAMERDHRAMEALRGHAVVLVAATGHGWEVGRGTGAYDKISGEPHHVCDVQPAGDPADAILAALGKDTD